MSTGITYYNSLCLHNICHYFAKFEDMTYVFGFKLAILIIRDKGRLILFWALSCLFISTCEDLLFVPVLPWLKDLTHTIPKSYLSTILAT